MNIFAHLADAVAEAVRAVQADGGLPSDLPLPAASVEPTRDKSHGDLATNAAMVLAKPAKAKPRDLAEKIASKLAQLYDEKLIWRHGLSAVRDRDLPQMQQLLSPTAYYLVTARHLAWSGGRHPFERIARNSLDPLLTELEHL